MANKKAPITPAMAARGRFIQSLRIVSNLTQVEVADAIGVARPTYTGIEAGANTTPETWAALAKLFKVTIEQLQNGGVGEAAPKGGDSIDLVEEAAVINLWRSLSRDKRRALVTFLDLARVRRSERHNNPGRAS